MFFVPSVLSGAGVPLLFALLPGRRAVADLRVHRMIEMPLLEGTLFQDQDLTNVSQAQKTKLCRPFYFPPVRQEQPQRP